MPRRPPVALADPFDLPDWVGTEEVTWTARSGIRDAHVVTGFLVGGGERLACDLLAADVAYPEPALDEKWRHDAHQAWTHGEVLLVEYDGRTALAVPGTGFTADLVLETLARLARAVGASPQNFVAALRL